MDLRRSSLPVVAGTVLALVALLPFPGAAPAGAATASLSPAGSISRALSAVHASGGTREAFSTPAVADITGDGRPDLVAAGLDGTVEAYALPARSRLWSV